jgi:hypothetical protein
MPERFERDHHLPPLPPANVTIETLYALVVSMHEAIQRRDAMHSQRIADFTGELARMRQEQADLLEAWRTSKNVVAFVKSIVVLGAAIGACWLALEKIRALPTVTGVAIHHAVDHVLAALSLTRK